MLPNKLYIKKIFKFLNASLLQTLLDEEQQQTRLIEDTVQKLMNRLQEKDSLGEERVGLENQFEVVYMFRPNGMCVILVQSFMCDSCAVIRV